MPDIDLIAQHSTRRVTTFSIATVGVSSSSFSANHGDFMFTVKSGFSGSIGFERSIDNGTSYTTVLSSVTTTYGLWVCSEPSAHGAMYRATVVTYSSGPVVGSFDQ